MLAIRSTDFRLKLYSYCSSDYLHIFYVILYIELVFPTKENYQAILMKSETVSFVLRKYSAARNLLNYFVTESRADDICFCDPKHLVDFKPLVKYGTDMKFKFYIHHHISYECED